MPESKVISVRIPDLLLAKVDLVAAEDYPSRNKKSSNRSQVILDALDCYFAQRESKEDEVDIKIREAIASLREEFAPILTAHNEVEELLGKLEV